MNSSVSKETTCNNYPEKGLPQANQVPLYSQQSPPQSVNSGATDSVSQLDRDVAPAEPPVYEQFINSQHNYIIGKPDFKPIANIYCISGTYGGYDGPSGLYSRLDPNNYNSNIIRIHTSKDLNLCVQQSVSVILEVNNRYNLPIILIGWSQGGYTAINAIEELANNNNMTIYKKIKCLIVISSKPEDTDFISLIENIKKYILCGRLDTSRRLNGAINMFEESKEPKELIIIEDGTHNFEYEECFNELFYIVDDILVNVTNCFL
jgi:hypothetical protein